MTQIHLNLINFPHCEPLLRIFGGYPDDFEFTAWGVFRKILPPLCPVNADLEHRKTGVRVGVIWSKRIVEN